MQVIQPRLQSWGELYPNQLDGLALWLDAIDQNSLLASDGSVIEDGEAVALWSDKSGNSAENCLVLNGVSGNYASISSADVPAAFGSLVAIEIEASLDLDSMTTGARIVGRSSSSGNRGFYLAISSSGLLQLLLSEDGTATTVATSDDPVTFVAFQKARIKSTWTASTGVVQFFESLDDGDNWSQLGLDESIAYAGIYNNSLVGITIGQAAGLGYIGCRIYDVIIRSSVGGTIILNPDFTTASKLATSFTESSSNAATVTINTTGATGARISGARDLYQGTVANRPVFLKYNGEKYGYFNGAASNGMSAPYSAAFGVTGNLEVECEVAANYSTGATMAVIARRGFGGGAAFTAFQFALGASGELSLVASDGTTLYTYTSIAHGVANYTRARFKAALTLDNGGGASSCAFYVFSGGSWMLFDTQTAAVISSLTTAATEGITIGTRSGAVPLTGSVYNAIIRNGIGGPAVASFDADDYSSGASFVSSATGETYTLSGGSHIVQRTGLYFDGVNDYLKSASFSLSQPETAYVVGNQVSWTSGDYIIDGNATNSLGVAQTTSSPQISMSAGSLVAENSDWTLKTAAVVSSVFNGASSQIRVNRGTATTGNAGAANASGFTLGAIGAATTNYGNVFISEVPVYSTAQDTATQDRVALYAGKKWKFAV